MTSYTVNFNGSGEVLEHHFDSDVQAVLWITRELATRGYNLEDLDSGGWDSDGVNEEDELCYRMFFGPTKMPVSTMTVRTPSAACASCDNHPASCDSRGEYWVLF